EPTKTAGKDEKSAETAPQPKPLNVVLVADVDVFSPAFFSVRNMGLGMFEDQIGDFSVDNVAFVLNTLDELAGEKRFIEIRKRRRMYRSLTMIDDVVKKGDQRVAHIQETTKTEMENKIEDERARLKKKSDEMKAIRDKKVDEINQKSRKLFE